MEEKRIEKLHLLSLLNSKRKKVGETLFIAIDGHGGSGKSTMADYLADYLQAEIIRVDDFDSYIESVPVWPRLVADIFDPIQNGATTLSYNRTKFWEDHDPEPVQNQKVTPIMIIEGVKALRVELRKYIGFGFFIDTPRRTCLLRGLQRDLVGTAKSELELTQIWENWLENDAQYFRQDQPKQYADFVIDGMLPFKDQFDI